MSDLGVIFREDTPLGELVDHAKRLDAETVKVLFGSPPFAAIVIIRGDQTKKYLAALAKVEESENADG